MGAEILARSLLLDLSNSIQRAQTLHERIEWCYEGEDEETSPSLSVILLEQLWAFQANRAREIASLLEDSFAAHLETCSEWPFLQSAAMDLYHDVCTSDWWELDPESSLVSDLKEYFAPDNAPITTLDKDELFHWLTDRVLAFEVLRQADRKSAETLKRDSERHKRWWTEVGEGTRARAVANDLEKWRIDSGLRITQMDEFTRAINAPGWLYFKEVGIMESRVWDELASTLGKSEVSTDTVGSFRAFLSRLEEGWPDLSHLGQSASEVFHLPFNVIPGTTTSDCKELLVVIASNENEFRKRLDEAAAHAIRCARTQRAVVFLTPYWNTSEFENYSKTWQALSQAYGCALMFVLHSGKNFSAVIRV